MTNRDIGAVLERTLAIDVVCPILDLHIVDSINRGLTRRFVLVVFSDGTRLHLTMN